MYFMGCFYFHSSFHGHIGSPLTQSIFRCVPSTTLKLVETILFISIESFRVLGPPFLSFVALWSMSCLAFCASFCSPVRHTRFLLHYNRVESYLY